MQPRWAVCATGAGAHQGQTNSEGEKDIWWTARTARGGTGHLGRTQTQRGRLWTACGQRCVDRKNSQTTPATTSTSSIRQLLDANYWAPLTHKRHTMPHSAQSQQHANYWAPRTRKRHQQEHRPQRPTESSDPTQHAKGRTGDRSGPRKEATTRRNVTQGAGQGALPSRSQETQCDEEPTKRRLYLLAAGLPWRLAQVAAETAPRTSCLRYPPHPEGRAGGGGATRGSAHWPSPGAQRGSMPPTGGRPGPVLVCDPPQPPPPLPPPPGF